MNKRQGSWTQAELIQCLCFYASYSLQERASISSKDLEILAKKMPKRSTGSIARRLANFVNRDAELRRMGKIGLSGGGAHVDVLWGECSDEYGALSLEKVLRKVALSESLMDLDELD